MVWTYNQNSNTGDHQAYKQVFLGDTGRCEESRNWQDRSCLSFVIIFGVNWRTCRSHRAATALTIGLAMRKQESRDRRKRPVFLVIERTSTKARWERTLAPAEVHFSNPIPCETGTACEVLKQ